MLNHLTRQFTNVAFRGINLYLDIGGDDMVCGYVTQKTKSKNSPFFFDDIFLKSVNRGMIVDMERFYFDLSMLCDMVDIRSLKNYLYPLTNYDVHIITRTDIPKWQVRLLSNVANELLFDHLTVDSHESICRRQVSQPVLRIYMDEMYVGDKLVDFSPGLLSTAVREFFENKYMVSIKGDEIDKLLVQYFTQDHMSIGKKIIKYQMQTVGTGNKSHISAHYHEITESIRPVMKIFLNETSNSEYFLARNLDWMNMMLENKRYKAFDRTSAAIYKKQNRNDFYYLDTLIGLGLS